MSRPAMNAMDRDFARMFDTNGEASIQQSEIAHEKQAAMAVLNSIHTGEVDLDKLTPDQIIKMASIVHAGFGEAPDAPTPERTPPSQPSQPQTKEAGAENDAIVDELVQEFLRSGLGQEAGEKFASIIIKGGKLHAHAQWRELQNIAEDQQIKEAQAEFLKISGAEWLDAIQHGEIDLSELTADESAYILHKIAEHKQHEATQPSRPTQAQPTQKVASIEMTDMQKTAAAGACRLLGQGDTSFLEKMSQAELVDLEHLMMAHMINHGLNPNQAQNVMHKIANELTPELQAALAEIGGLEGPTVHRAPALEDLMATGSGQGAEQGFLSRLKDNVVGGARRAGEGVANAARSAGGHISGAAQGADAWMQNMATKLPGITAESAPWLKRLAAYGIPGAALAGTAGLTAALAGRGKADSPEGMEGTASAGSEKDLYEQEVLKTAQAILTQNGHNHGSNPFEPGQVYDDAKKLLRSVGWNIS